MKFRFFIAKLTWPVLFVSLMLQRSPVIRYLTELEFSLLPRTQHMWRAVVAAVTVGAYNTVTAASGDLIFHEGEDDTTVFVGEELRLVVEVEGSSLLTPQTWIVEGDLPAGVSYEIFINLGIVVISGIPTEPGTFPIIVKAWELPRMMGDVGTPLAFDIIVEAVGPLFTQQPSNQTVTSGDTLNLSAAVETPKETTYQWQRMLSGDTEYQSLVGEVGSTLTINNITSINAGTYRVVATNTDGSTNSDSATVVVEVPVPVFNQQPLDQTVTVGDTLSLSAQAESAEATTYQWQRILSGETEYQNLPGEVSGMLSIVNIMSEDAGMYRVVATNPGGSTNSQPATVTVLEEPVGPVFSEQPTDQTVFWGGLLNFLVSVEIPEGTSYQWQRILSGEAEYKNLENETASSLSLDKVTSADEGMYRVLATDLKGTVVSNAAMILVSATPLQLWKETNFDDPFSSESDGNSDPDFDTLTNVVEFTFGLNPMVPEKEAFVRTTQENIDGVPYIVFTFPPIANGMEPGLSLESNATLDLVGWASLENGVNGTIVESSLDGYIVKIPASKGGFTRLRIVSN